MVGGSCLCCAPFRIISYSIQVEQLHEEHEGRLSNLRSELDERRLRELATVKDVLQREKEHDLRELEAQLNLDLVDKLKSVRQDLEKQFQVRE